MKTALYKEKLNEYFKSKNEVLAVYLFGSTARGKENAYSDVDIAILYDDSVPASEYTDRQISLIVELSAIINKNVDVVVLNRAGAYLKFQVMREGVRIYESPKRQGRPFEARAMIEYFDFLPIKTRIENAIIAKLRKA